MNPVELIRKKRNGKILTKKEIYFLINSYTKHNIPDYQFSALLMAILFVGMTKKETAILTEAMLYSGKVINLDSIRGTKVDKHSTGGVGDKTSFILTPIVAAAGVSVPMISGRGLGHTGGTLDKLEAIPGFRTDLSLSEYKRVIKKCGAVMIGQTKDIAPADKLIYSLRDVTATVESIPLITASVMSKKLAEGIDGLVLDIKTGNGAFMKETQDAILLGNSLIDIAKAFNKKVIGFITDMNQPLGNYIGNWLEIYESVKVLQGEIKGDLLKLSINLSGAMIYLGGKASSIKEGIEISQELIKNGKAFQKFYEIVKVQGGRKDYIENPDKYPKSKAVGKIYSKKSGYVKKIDAFGLGIAALELGAGRMKKEDKIEPKAGIIFYPKIGDKIKKGDLIAELRCESAKKIMFVKQKFYGIIEFSDTEISKPRIIKKIIN